MLQLSTKRGIEKFLAESSTANCGYLPDAPSRKIAGQFGAESIVEGINKIHVYIDSALTDQQRGIVQEIVKTCINRTVGINKNFLDLEVRVLILHYDGQKPKLTNYRAVKWQSDLNLDNRIKVTDSLSHTAARMHLQEGVLIFITNEDGCEIDNEYLKSIRKIAGRSLWIKVSSNTIDIQKGLPEYCKR